MVYLLRGLDFCLFLLKMISSYTQLVFTEGIYLIFTKAPLFSFNSFYMRTCYTKTLRAGEFRFLNLVRRSVLQ